METAQLALVMVDVQHDFWRPLAKLPEFASFPSHIGTLLHSARSLGLTIIHTQAVFQPDGSDWMLFYRSGGRGRIPCIAGSPGAQFEDFAVPLSDEIVVAKQTFDGFAGTNLEQVLRDRGIRAQLIAGLETSVCVLFTATSAYLKRFVPIVVSDACADLTERHSAALKLYGGLCFQQATTAQVRDDWGSLLQLADSYIGPETAAAPQHHGAFSPPGCGER